MQELAERGGEALAAHMPQLQAICLQGLQNADLAVRQAALLAVSGLLGAPPTPAFLYLFPGYYTQQITAAGVVVALRPAAPNVRPLVNSVRGEVRLSSIPIETAVCI